MLFLQGLNHIHPGFTDESLDRDSPFANSGEPAMIATRQQLKERWHAVGFCHESWRCVSN